MLRTAEQLVKIAMAEVGYKEKATNAQLDDKTANAGKGNYTKYARDLREAGYYNGNKNGYDWCDVFVDWCFYQLCGKDAAEAQKLQYQTGELGASCTWSSRYYTNAGRWRTEPEVGDQVFFQSGGSLYHTGIVVDVADGIVTTVEGNYSEQVSVCTYQVTDKRLAGYGRPKYDEATLGDVNGDGKVNAADATRILLSSVDKVELTQAEQAAADVNGDGKVNAADAAKILAASVGKAEL